MPASPGALGRRLVVVGQGYVGLPLAMRMAEVGYQVVGYDVTESNFALCFEVRCRT